MTTPSWKPNDINRFEKIKPTEEEFTAYGNLAGNLLLHVLRPNSTGLDARDQKVVDAIEMMLTRVYDPRVLNAMHSALESITARAVKAQTERRDDDRITMENVAIDDPELEESVEEEVVDDADASVQPQPDDTPPADAAQETRKTMQAVYEERLKRQEEDRKKLEERKRTTLDSFVPEGFKPKTDDFNSPFGQWDDRKTKKKKK